MPSPHPATLLQATLAEREGRIRALSAQVADIQRRLGDNTRQARMQTLEREAAALRETRAELQVSKDSKSRSLLVAMHTLDALPSL